jgi:hypothetical protein
MSILLAIIIGGAFGFTLDRVGATNPGFIIRMLNLTNLHLMKTILLAIGTASFLMFGGLLLGFVDPGHMSVKTAYSGVFIGGLLLGAGFAISGFCPGTSLTAAATGRKDALFFILGGLLGAAAYMGAYSGVKATGLLDKIAGGKATLGAIDGTKYPSLIEGMSGEMLGIVGGIIFIALATLAPAHIFGSKK